MKLIDADELLCLYNMSAIHESGEYGLGCIDIINDIKNAPTVNAVEVVRCKDCKWYRIARIDNVPYCCYESGYCGEHMGGLFFCACGERRNDG